jgi:pimeloyl-ACP methyl ester carboxylesterase
MTNIGLGQTINGSLSSTDDVNPKRSGGFLDEYTLDGLSDWQQVQVSLDSTAIDSYLQLINASTGRQIIFDDNSGGNLNSKLSFTKLPGVNYILWATSANSEQTGNYTFKTSSLGTASSLVVTRNGQEAGTVDPLGRFVQIGSFVETGSSSRFADIAFSNDNKLLGIKNDSLPTQLYKINPETGSSSVIGNFPSGVEMIALESSPSNILYGASRSNGSNKSKLYTINPQTGAASSIANFPWDEGLSGDIVFDPVNNRFLFAKGSGSSYSLFSVSLTGQSTKIGDIGFGGVFGLSFEGNTLVGFTGDNKRIIINPATGKGTFDRNITGLSDGYTINGAGSIPSATRTTTPTSPAPNPTPEKLPNTVTADFVDSDTDKILKNSLKSLIVIDDVPSVVQLGLDLSGFKTSIREVDDLDDFKYGEWQQGIKKAEKKATREVKIRELSESRKPENTWVLIHGLNDNSDRFLDLEKALKAAKPNDRVLLLDWSDASSNGTLPKDKTAVYATARLGNYFAAKWATPVAEWAVKKLEQEYGIDGKVASENLKIIGHSLGSLVSSEMGRIYTLGKNRNGDNVLPNANGLNTLIALDPPSQLNIDIYSDYTASYDLDGRTAKADRPEFFQDIARNSLAFVGAKSIAGNQRLAAGALNSFQMDFGSDIKKLDEVTQEHFDVIKTFTELIKEKGEIGNRILNNQTFNAKQNTFIYDDRDAQNGLAHEGVLFVEQRNQPTDLIVRNAKTSDKNDSIFYGTPKNDRVIGGLYKDNILADAGNDTLYGLTGDDTLYGQAGDDTIYGGKDNDTLFGDQGDDFLSGENGNDYLNGGLDNDTLIGVNQNEDRRRGFGQIDTLIGGGGADLFILGTTKTGTLYDDGIDDATNGIRDYALIVDFGNIGGQDTIQLRGTKSQYILGNSPNGLPVGTGIYLDTNRNQQFDPKDELIAIVQQGGVGPTLGTPVTLNLDASYFKYV